MESREAIVIGAGPAGLATAAMLKKRGIDVLVLERDEAVGSSWRKHYDRLHLHTVRWLSHLPGYRFSRKHGRWVSRDGVIRYLEGYTRHHGLEVRTGTEVSAIERLDGGWLLGTPSGDITARHVVVATGYNHTPFIPDFPGTESFTGELTHASTYRNPEPYRGRDVLVVGSGNTGAEIAVDLAEGGAARVRLAVRTPPNIVLRELNGVPNQVTGVLFRRFPPKVVDAIAFATRKGAIGDLSQYGLPLPDRGVYTRVLEDDVIPVIDVGLIGAVKGGEVEIVGGVEGFDGAGVLLAGGERIQPEAVIVATGWLRALEPLVGKYGVLGHKGRPVVHGPDTHPGAPRMYFIGYSNPISGMFRELNIDSRRIARAVDRDRRRTGETGPLEARREPVAA
jgi:cation diffusion facilitator CzcD-associated flavoprotein CzcO